MFLYRPVCQARTSITARGVAEGSCRQRAWYRADMKTAVWSNLPIRQWIDYFICHNSVLEYVESNWWMTDRLLQCLYSNSASYNQSETSVAANDIWKFQTTLQPIKAHALISAPGIFIYNGSLLMIIVRC